MKLPELNAVRNFFFEAMLDGWSNPDIQKVPIRGLPGSKSISISKGDFVMIDCYFTNQESPKSGGFTVISHQGVQVWMMGYGGWYRKEAIVFLKSALSLAYKRREFYGGRGPLFLPGNDYSYHNNVEMGDFARFRGTESIKDKNGETVGFHDYWGMSMLPNNNGGG
jgi:hypothetical protein